MRLLLPAAALLAALAASARAGTVDEDLVPGGKVLSTVFPTDEIERYRVAAPAGSVLQVDLRPLTRGGFAPALAATLSDGSGGTVPPPGATGRTKVSLPFPVDGVLELLVLSGRGGSGDYLLGTRLRVPAGPDLEGSVEGPEGVEFVFAAPAGALATVTVRAAAASSLIPTIDSVAGPDGEVEPGNRRANPTFDQWLQVPQDALGPWTLRVVGNLLTTGDFTGTIRWKAPRGPDGDHREDPDFASVEGTFGVLLAGPSPAGGTLPVVVSGGVALDAKGRARSELAGATHTFDAAAPLGIAHARAPFGRRRGAAYPVGPLSSVHLDLGKGKSIGSDFAVAAGGTVLYAGLGAGPSPARGLLLGRVPAPAAADLAGSWFYVDVARDAEGVASVEVGTLDLGANGTVTGSGTRTVATLVGGKPTPGASTAVLRAGTFAAAADGTVTVTTAPEGGPSAAWPLGTLLGAEVLAGLDPSGAGGRVLARRGAGQSAASFAGDYLHFGIAITDTVHLRTGILALDGAGVLGGNETVTDLAGGGVPATTPMTGTYAVDGQGGANFGIDGGAQGSGAAGPAARYLFSTSFGSGGVGFDLLVDLE